MWAALNLGVSRGDDPDHVRENYRRFFAAIGADGKKLAMTNQVHGGRVRVVTSADWKDDPYQRPDYEADGLMTDTPGVVLLIYSADCIPILLYDPVRRVIAATHAGWRGTAAGIAAAAVERMKEIYECRPEDILAAIGPGIGPCCFETHEDVPNAMMAAVSSAALPYVKVLENGKFTLDLKGINAPAAHQSGAGEGAHCRVPGLHRVHAGEVLEPPAHGHQPGLHGGGHPAAVSVRRTATLLLAGGAGLQSVGVYCRRDRAHPQRLAGAHPQPAGSDPTLRPGL